MRIDVELVLADPDLAEPGVDIYQHGPSEALSRWQPAIRQNQQDICIVDGVQIETIVERFHGEPVAFSRGEDDTKSRIVAAKPLAQKGNLCLHLFNGSLRTHLLKPIHAAAEGPQGKSPVEVHPEVPAPAAIVRIPHCVCHQLDDWAHAIAFDKLAALHVSACNLFSTSAALKSSWAIVAAAGAGSRYFAATSLT